ncbi:MAG: rRNA maturation RNase YbeY [Rhodospirillaceae bacterium]
MSVIEIIINRETESWPDGIETTLETAARAALATCPSDHDLELGLTLADDAAVHELNLEHRAKDAPTNVLSFPLTDGSLKPDAPGAPILLGDVIMAQETIEREAVEQGKSFTAHAVHLTVHGVLHLLGHDHETDAEASAMETLETEVLGRLGLANPYQTPPERP